MKDRYLLRGWILGMGVLTVLIGAIPIQATFEMTFTIFLLVVVLKLLSEKREYLIIPVIISSGLYWLSSVFSGTVAFILSLGGVGLAAVVAICLADKRQELKKEKNSG